MLAAQNEEMRSLGFQLKRLKHPQDKKVYIGFVNTVSVSKPVAGHRKLIVACLRKPATAACICIWSGEAAAVAGNAKAIT
jgi:hypothetical protein